MLGVGANESFIEDAAGELIEVFFFDGLQHARADFCDIRDVIERKFFGLARLAEFCSEVTHETSWPILRNIIGQDWRVRYGTGVQGEGNVAGASPAFLGSGVRGS